MKMNSITSLFLMLCIAICSSCTIKENFHFNTDLSGQYIFQFDYSALLEFDSTGAASESMDEGYLEMEKELQAIDGIRNIIIVTDNEQGKVLVSYDFDNIQALNESNYNKESERYNKFFRLDGNKLEFIADFSDELDEYKEPGMDDEELLNNIEGMIDYTITFSFDGKIKTIDLENIEKVDDQTLSYTLNRQGVLSPSRFQVKLK